MQEPESLKSPETWSKINTLGSNIPIKSEIRSDSHSNTGSKVGPNFSPDSRSEGKNDIKNDVKSFAQLLYALDANKDAARLALLSYLINFYEPHSTLDQLVFENFYLQAMGFEFWQHNWPHLNEQLQTCVSQIVKKNRQFAPVFDWLKGAQMQPVVITSQKNLSALIYKHLEKNLEATAQFKIIKASDEHTLAVIYDSAQNLTVKIFSNVFVLSEAELVPANPDFQISYDSQLNLKENVYQHIPIGPHTSAKFALSERGIVGKILRGYTFAKFEDLTGGALSQYANVFFPFKKFESLYINLKTDPFYNEMISTLEQATEALHQQESSGRSTAARMAPRSQHQIESLLQRAKLAQENIFQNDKMLQLLISNLEKTLSLKNLTEFTNESFDSNGSEMMDV